MVEEPLLDACARAVGVALSCPVPEAERPCHRRVFREDDCTCRRVAKAVMNADRVWRARRLAVEQAAEAALVETPSGTGVVRGYGAASEGK